MLHFSVSSKLNSEPEQVWQSSISPSGINSEFKPVLKMSFPANLNDITKSWQPGKKLFRSWLLLAGFLPIEYDDVSLIEVIPGQKFYERSSLMSQKIWEHERSLSPLLNGCEITDTIRFSPRIERLGFIYLAIFKFVFNWRHRNLRKQFGSHLITASPYKLLQLSVQSTRAS